MTRNHQVWALKKAFAEQRVNPIILLFEDEGLKLTKEESEEIYRIIANLDDVEAEEKMFKYYYKYIKTK